MSTVHSIKQPATLYYSCELERESVFEFIIFGFCYPTVDPCYNTDPCKNDGQCYVADDYSFFCVCPIPKAYTGADCGTQSK